MRRVLSLMLVLFMLIPAFAIAHGGKTDGKGGHRDKSTGEYHYHHGYPAHLHIDGECIYDYDDQTGKNSGEPSSGSSLAHRTVSHKVIKQTSPNLWEYWWVPLIGIGTAWIAYLVIKYRREETERLRKEELKRQRYIEGLNIKYANNSLESLAGMPDGLKIGPDGLPKEILAEEGWGTSCTRFLASPTAKTIHSNGCRFLKYTSCKINIYDPKCPQHLCSICNPAPLPDTKWYKKYLSLKWECEREKIKPISHDEWLKKDKSNDIVHISWREFPESKQGLK